MTRSNKNRKIKTNKGVVLGEPLSTQTRTRKPRPSPSQGMMTNVVRLPPVFRSRGDEFGVRLRSTLSISNTTTNASSLIIGLTPNVITASGYKGLGNIFTMLPGISSSYAHFMISRLSAEVTPVTAVTAGGLVAVGFEADDTNTSGPPANLSDVCTAVHSDVAQVTETACITLKPAEYYNAWCNCTTTTGSATSLSQCGAVQVLGLNSAANGDPVAVLMMELDIWFSGYRATS